MPGEQSQIPSVVDGPKREVVGRIRRHPFHAASGRVDSSQARSPGSPANGLQFERIGATVQKVATHVWSLEGIAAGTAAWARLLGNAADAGDESLVMPRIDFAIGDLDTAGDYQMRLPILAITNGLSIPIEQWTYSLPPIGA